jgi:hypothetical protein
MLASVFSLPFAHIFSCTINMKVILALLFSAVIAFEPVYKEELDDQPIVCAVNNLGLFKKFPTICKEAKEKCSSGVNFRVKIFCRI